MAFQKSTSLAACLVSLTFLITTSANTLYSDSYRSLYQLYPNQQHNVLSLEEEIRHRNHLQRMLENFIKEKERKQQQKEAEKMETTTMPSIPNDEDEDEDEENGPRKNSGTDAEVNKTNNVHNKVRLSNAEKRKMVDLLQKLMNVLRREYLHDGHYVD